MAKTAVRKGAGSPAAGAGDPALARLEQALRSAVAGDFAVRMPARRKDQIGELETPYNDLAARNAALEAELVRVAQIIGREGRMTERAKLQRDKAIAAGASDDITKPVDVDQLVTMMRVWLDA